MNKTAMEHDALTAHAEECEPAAADTRGEAALLEEKIENLTDMLDQ